MSIPSVQIWTRQALLGLLALNLVLPAFDPKHPLIWAYAAVGWAFERWVGLIGWLTSLADPLLPRTFTFGGTANFLASTLVALALVLLGGWGGVWLWRRWGAPWLQRRGAFQTLRRWNRPTLHYVMLAVLTALLLPSLVRWLTSVT